MVVRLPTPPRHFGKWIKLPPPLPPPFGKWVRLPPPSVQPAMWLSKPMALCGNWISCRRSLVGGLAKVNGTFPTLEPVVEDVQELCASVGGFRGYGRSCHGGTSQRLATLQGQLVRVSETLPEAEQACAQLGSLCEKLGNQADTAEVADRQLAELSRLKSELLVQARSLPEAAAVLTQVWELRDGLIRSNSTLSEIQHLVVDMVLLEPAVKRAMLSLKPVVEMTRLSRQIESPQLESSTPTGEETKQECGQPAKANANADVGNPTATWSEIFEVAVAWCQRSLK